jgi:hypothetical protein
MHIEIAQHINGDSYGQKNINLHEGHFFFHFGVVKNDVMLSVSSFECWL